MQVLKAVVAEFDAGELITQRELVSHRVHQVICLIQSSFSCLLQSSFILYINFFFPAKCCLSGPGGSASFWNWMLILRKVSVPTDTYPHQSEKPKAVEAHLRAM
jgi:hypothetical protein